MTRPRIALVNASHDDANTLRNFRREVDADLVNFDVTSGRLPPADADVDAAIVTGSSSSVYWDEDWIDPAKAAVERFIDDGLPVLGVCYGHQLVADVLGGTVEGMGEYELGYREITHTGDSRLFEGIDETFLAFTTHSDTVTELPPGATELAANDYGNHAFRAGNVFGVQFHPEYDLETAEAVTREKDLPAARIEAVLEDVTEANHRRACEAKTVFENFTAFVRERAPPATADD